MDTQAVRVFYPHGIGHTLGLDVHDVLHDPEVRKKHRGRVDFAKAEAYLDLGGVRIEDDVEVRKDAPPVNLTPTPKTVAAVEAACAG